MTGMMIFNLIAAIAVVAGLVTICRTAYVVAGRSTEAPEPVEAAAQRELKRASFDAVRALSARSASPSERVSAALSSAPA